MSSTNNLLHILESKAALYPNYLIKTSVLVLLENGADPNAKYMDGTSVIDRAIYILDYYITSNMEINKYIFCDRLSIIIMLMQYGGFITITNETSLVRLLSEEYAIALIEFAYGGDKSNTSFVFHIARLILYSIKTNAQNTHSIITAK